MCDCMTMGDTGGDNSVVAAPKTQNSVVMSDMQQVAGVMPSHPKVAIATYPSNVGPGAYSQPMGGGTLDPLSS